MKQYLWMTVLLCSAGSVSAQTQRFQATRDLRIGSADDADYSLTWMQGIKVGPDGSIYSLHYQERAVRRFDASGKLIRKFGREGAGPGEFRHTASMNWRGDTLYVFDSGQRRFNYFTASG